jgi:hypothetical protein
MWQSCLRDPCEVQGEFNTTIKAIFLQNNVPVIPFTKVYAIGGTGALGLSEDKKGYDLPFNLETKSISFVFEKNTEKETITLLYEPVCVSREGCPPVFEIQNPKVDFNRTSFDASQIVLRISSQSTITITLP